MEVRTHCMLCSSPLSTEPVIQLKNLPIGVQNLPENGDSGANSGATLRAYQCAGCGHIQLNSAPIVYHQRVTSTTAYSKAMLQLRLDQLRTFVEQYHLQGKRILDVGCGDGQTMHLVDEAGATPIGVDASEKSLTIARDLGYTAHYGYITREYTIADAPYDGFVCYDVIEHVPDLKDFLQGIAANMATGAIGLIETPNFDKVIEQQRYYDFMLDHLSYFTPESLRLSAEIGGFEVIHVEKNRDEENLTMIVRKRPLVDFGAMREHMQHLGKSLHTFIEGHHQNGRRIAIWGASLQTLTLSTQVELKVAYVIDSAPYKQGRVTPISHLPIVSPDILNTDPVDVIIVNAPRYEDEIIRQIQEDIGFSSEIAVLDGQTINVIQE